jgi:hypothetical protein
MPLMLFIISSRRAQDVEYVKSESYYDDLLIITTSGFKDHLLSLEMVIATISANDFLV